MVRLGMAYVKLRIICSKQKKKSSDSRNGQLALCARHQLIVLMDIKHIRNHRTRARGVATRAAYAPGAARIDSARWIVTISIHLMFISMASGWRARTICDGAHQHHNSYAQRAASVARKRRIKRAARGKRASMHVTALGVATSRRHARGRRV